MHTCNLLLNLFGCLCVFVVDCVLWRHPILLHTKEPITSALSSVHSEELQCEAIKLFKVNAALGNLKLHHRTIILSKSFRLNA